MLLRRFRSVNLSRSTHFTTDSLKTSHLLKKRYPNPNPNTYDLTLTLSPKQNRRRLPRPLRDHEDTGSVCRLTLKVAETAIHWTRPWNSDKKQKASQHLALPGMLKYTLTNIRQHVQQMTCTVRPLLLLSLENCVTLCLKTRIYFAGHSFLSYFPRSLIRCLSRGWKTSSGNVFNNVDVRRQRNVFLTNVPLAQGWPRLKSEHLHVRCLTLPHGQQLRTR